MAIAGAVRFYNLLQYISKLLLSDPGLFRFLWFLLEAKSCSATADE